MLLSSFVVALQVQPYFISRLRSPLPDVYGRLGTNERALDALVDRVCRDVERNVPSGVGVTTTRVAMDLKAVCDPLLDENTTRGLRSWRYAESVCAWTRFNVYYDESLLNLTGSERAEQNKSYNVLKRSPPSATCGGFARLVSVVAGKMGLSCGHVGGVRRPYGKVETNRDGHGWNVFHIAGMDVPADTVESPEHWKAGTTVKTKEWMVMPRRREAWELFLAGHYETYKVDYAINTQGREIEGKPYDPTSDDVFLNMKFPTGDCTRARI